jgi:hypothetical protein
MKTLKAILYSTIILFGAATPAFAVDAPTFPNCPNPGGVQIASYTDGTHGIPGRSEVYTGNDTVFRLDEKRVAQCYCPPDGTGIQTNWFKVSDLTSDQKTELIQRGWVYIPDGTVWGLDAGDWMAQNSPLTCTEHAIGGSGLSTIFPQILGFADTGKMLFYRGVISMAGFTSIALGIMVLVFALKEKKK